MALSEFAIRKAKPKEKPYRMPDGLGLYLLIQPSGSKLWQMRYRFNNKENVLSFGRYPTIGLAAARRKRDEAKELIADGINPATQRRLDKIAAENAARQTFGLIADEYLERLKQEGAAEGTLTKTEWLLKKLAAPLAKRPIAEITPAEILHLLQQIEKSGRRETARRLRGTISTVFKLAIVTLRAESDPTIPLHGALKAPQVTGRAAITDEKKFGVLLNALDDYDGWPTIKAAIQFLILTCVRPGEVRGAVRSEFDLDKAVWHIPAERMKMRQPHDVPLSRQALVVLRGVWSFSEHAELVFPSIRSKRRPLSDNAFNAALRRMGYSKEEVTAHGFRVTASTILNSRGYNPDVIEAVLAHQDKNSIRRTYNRATYWEQRVVLMQDWADLLDKV
ncbi:integrase [Rhodobium orientis]|uniref:Integrase n=1 Tax=Rhodobium orientis TaxID=34017 RepID=A0A327JIM7_9HYPH|nr:integrase arm-type DNA-binding domain-containing protein [Rhodobium orientis]MBB4302841.1 integrase [Rhodobium orientis]RAI26257.1 integrase [Rhodobium orientis]